MPAECLLFICFSKSLNAPPTMNSIFFVSMVTICWSGCFLPPCGGTLHSVPSTIFNNPCCTPSPDTSLVIDVLSPLRQILSISSMNIIPFSANCTSPSALANSFCTTFSTSSPTYPDSVSVVASAIAKGTFKYFAIVFAVSYTHLTLPTN